MDRATARRIAAQHTGDDHPQPGYDITPTTTDPHHWLGVARHAARRGDTRMLGWLWRHCPDVPVHGYEVTLPGVIDAIGIVCVSRQDD